MQYSVLGKSDLNVSSVSFGCMSLNGSTAENEVITGKAIASGINLFDTADLYENGGNEVKIGNLVKSCRKDIVLATKVGNQSRPDGSGWDWNPGKEYILSAVEKSLKRLQTDYIDLYQLHGGTMDDPMDETIEAFERLKEQGKIRHYGISSIRPNVIREYVKRSNIVSVMTQYSLLDRRPEEESLDLLEENGIGVLCRGSIAQGLLVDKPAKAYLNWSEQEVAGVARAVTSFNGNRGPSAETAIRYVLQHPAVKTAVVGIRTLEQLEDVLRAADRPLFSAAELESLVKGMPVNYYQEHR